MGAGPWTIYNSAKRLLGEGAIDLSNDVFAMLLFTNASNASDPTMVVIGELNGEVADANGYAQGGQLMSGIIWDVADTPSELRFTCDALTWNAIGGDIADVQYAVIVRTSGGPSTDYLLCFAALDENGPFTVPDGDPLYVGINIGGIFELK
jgi:hypothetical protein